MQRTNHIYFLFLFSTSFYLCYILLFISLYIVLIYVYGVLTVLLSEKYEVKI